MPGGGRTYVGGKTKQNRTLSRPAHQGPGLWPRLLPALSPAFPHVQHSGHCPSSPFSRCHREVFVVNREFLNCLRGWGPNLHFPRRQLVKADTTNVE